MKLIGKEVYVSGSRDLHLVIAAIDSRIRLETYYKYRLLNIETSKILELWECDVFEEDNLEHTKTLIKQVKNDADRNQEAQLKIVSSLRKLAFGFYGVSLLVIYLLLR